MSVSGGAAERGRGSLRSVRRRREQPTPTAAEAQTPPRANLATKLMFAPVRLLARRIAPRLSAGLYRSLWRRLGGEDAPPRPEEPQQSVAKLGLALALEGAIAAIVGGVVDQLSRRQFARLTGRWPGRRRKR
jgi:Protein of unknown function (DUF4235)